MLDFKILVTGATGYVGGTVLAKLLSTRRLSTQNAKIVALVRGEDQVKILEANGVQTLQFAGFHDLDAIREIATGFDAVIHTASGFDAEVARAFIRGLADRKMRGGNDVFYVHTSGTTNLADSPLLGVYGSYNAEILSDQEPEKVIALLKRLNSLAPYPQREADLTVIALGKETGVRTTIVTLPMLYGLGQGKFNRHTGQVTMLIREAMKDGYVSIVGDGQGVKNHVHIEDAASFFEIVVSRILEGQELPHGERGILFAESGFHSWRDVGTGIADAGFDLGQLKTRDLNELGLEEAVHKLDWKNPRYTELAFVSSSRVSADTARSYGWMARKWPEDLSEPFLTEWKGVLAHEGPLSASGRGE